MTHPSAFSLSVASSVSFPDSVTAKISLRFPELNFPGAGRGSCEGVVGGKGPGRGGGGSLEGEGSGKRDLRM